MIFPRRDAADLPTVDAGQMREVDRQMEEVIGIGLIQMMENAGRNLADLTMSLFSPSRVTVLYGSGGNGGGALVAARHLLNRDVQVSLVASSDRLTSVPRLQRSILDGMGVLDTDRSAPPTGDLIIDGMVGYSLRGAPEGPVADLIEWANEGEAPVVSLDVPSGFLASTGETVDPHIRAAATLTLALPKSGMVGHPAVGRLFLGDISVPQTVYRSMGLAVPQDVFVAGQILQLL